MILLDTSVIIELFRKKNKDQTLFYAISKQEIQLGISAISHYEISVGNRELHSEFWGQIQKTITVIPFDESCSNAAANIYSDLRKKSKMIDLADLLIGATAVAHNIPIATLNTKHFQRIVGLKLY
ncbi:MAG: type II toxin-antitoxin system VapC family toxin [Flavobacteriales bacterium]|nr:type II toxin-antitoxin system VapC family toxin [Flavobacteriales bacterium]